MTRRAWLAAAALAWAAVSGPAHSNDEAPPQTGFLQVSDEGCVVGGGNGEEGVQWLNDRSAEYRLNLWLNSRESISPGPVEVDVTAGKVVAYVPVQVYPPREDEPVTTCIRRLLLNLWVSPIARGEYEWQFLRGTRSEFLATQAKAQAAPVQGADEPQDVVVPADAATPDDATAPGPAAGRQE